MSLWTRVGNVFQGRRLNREIDEELRSHFDEAIAEGRDPAEVRRSFGPQELLREESRSVKLIPWLDCLRADAVFGWRQLMKRKVASSAAILSLALAIGACTAAFRLIDAVLLRPLPVANPEQLYVLSREAIGFDGKPITYDSWAYPDFLLMRAAVQGQAELMAVSYAERMDLTYKAEPEMEKGWLQYVSGNMFGSFGLRPTVGRLLSSSDDVKPGGHPYAVISYDYWTRRFARDKNVAGRTFRLGDRLYEIVGVGPEGFNGTETGTVTDIFVPVMMHGGVLKDDWTWHRTLARVAPGVALPLLRARLDATSRAFERERARGLAGLRPEILEKMLAQTLVLDPASAGASGLQHDYRTSLIALGVLVALVLLIACVNVANLMTALAAARAREMALRVSIGAGRWRLIQLVLVEGAILAFLAGAIGAVFAWRSAPFVVSMINPPDNPVRLTLPMDWRVLGFGVALTMGVTLFLGLLPALRASAIEPVSALKGGDDPHARRRSMHVLIGLQTAFCFLVLFVAGLFVTTFERLSNRPTGFSAERVLALETVAARPQPPAVWDQVVEHLRTVLGVEKVGLASRVLLSGRNWNNSISVNGAPPNGVLCYLLQASPGWREALKIPLIAGRDFRSGDVYPGVAIVNQTFVKVYFNGETPIGKRFEVVFGEGHRVGFEAVGVAADVAYRNLRDPAYPQAYFPFSSVDDKGAAVPVGGGTFVVRTSIANPLALAPLLRREVPNARPEFRVSNILPQTEINESHTIRERLLARLAFFFGVVALLLAGVGLYGVLDYSVLQRRREIGIRTAVGSPAGAIARLVTGDIFAMVLTGSAAGLGLGLGAARWIDALLYQVKPTDMEMLALPALTILGVTLLAALPAVIRAVRIDPAKTLRAD
jgi:predicted permease